ncbi:MAG TPA: hypothetical protein VEM77_05915 [Thermoplasmata archaeon]|nr:hypothetical protein [Thermoplasmata archaeon]
MLRNRMAIYVAALAFAFVTSAYVVVPARADVESFTLYGGQSAGWGFTSTSLTNPGPTITVTQGDTVDLTLNSVDAALHDWFVDYNNNNAADTGEPKSGDFSGTTPGTFSFIADRVGTFTYRCHYHVATMRGQIVVQTPPTFELYGDGVRGWGEQNTTSGITMPGPTLTVNQSATVTIDLTAADGQLHSWFIDLNNDKIQQTSEPHSSDFAASTRYTFQVTLAPGNYTYRCQYHPNMMFGTFTVRATGGGGGPSGIDPTLLIGGIVIVIAIVAVAAAVMMRRKKPGP